MKIQPYNVDIGGQRAADKALVLGGYLAEGD